MESKIQTVAQDVDEKEKYTADMDQALAVAGCGWYNVRICLVLALFLIGAIVEPVGYSFVLPAAVCDLNVSTAQRGFIASVPYIGIVLTSFPWGYLVDTRGRKSMVVITSLVAGSLGVISAFMPDLITFTICKFIASLCIACPAAVPFTFIGEILPKKNRDLLLSITNALQISGTAIVPLIAWAILPLEFRIDFGLYVFRPWRLLTILYSMFFIVAAILMMFAPESPVFLVSHGKHDEALKVLQVIYASNKGKLPQDYPIKRLKSPEAARQRMSFFKSLKIQTLPLLRPPFLKWLLVNGFLLFGIFAVLNGLYTWVPDILNRVLTGSGAGLTACEVISQRLNETSDVGAECVDSIDRITFVINSIANISCTVIAIAVSSTVKLIGKKTMLVVIYALIGTFCILINFITEDMIFAVLLSTLQVLGLCIGPVNAYSVEIFPSYLRGMAVSLSMMFGRSGSVVGANVAGLMLNAACELTFYSFGGLLLICAILSLFLPASKGNKPKKTTVIITRL